MLAASFDLTNTTLYHYHAVCAVRRITVPCQVRASQRSCKFCRGTCGLDPVEVRTPWRPLGRCFGVTGAQCPRDSIAAIYQAGAIF